MLHRVPAHGQLRVRAGRPVHRPPAIAVSSGATETAATGLHDQGVANPERRDGKRPGSFGGGVAAATWVGDGVNRDLLATVSLLDEITCVLVVAPVIATLTAAGCALLL